jgi:hypothetical protein
MVVLPLGTSKRELLPRVRADCVDRTFAACCWASIGSLVRRVWNLGRCGWVVLNAKISKPITTSILPAPQTRHRTLKSNHQNSVCNKPRRHVAREPPSARYARIASVWLSMTNVRRTHRQMRGFADLGHYEWWQGIHREAGRFR